MKVLQQFSIANIEYYQVIELSEPVGSKSNKQESRLHTHGYIIFPNDDSLKWFLLYGSTILAKICRYEIDTIADFEYYWEYCHKQQFLGLPILHNLEFVSIAGHVICPEPRDYLRDTWLRRPKEKEKVPTAGAPSAP